MKILNTIIGDCSAQIAEKILSQMIICWMWIVDRATGIELHGDQIKNNENSCRCPWRLYQPEVIAQIWYPGKIHYSTSFASVKIGINEVFYARKIIKPCRYAGFYSRGLKLRELRFHPETLISPWKQRISWKNYKR